MGVVFWSLLNHVWAQSDMSGRCCVVTRVGGCHLMRNRRWTAAGEVMGGLVWQGVEGRREIEHIQQYENTKIYSNNIQQQQITTYNIVQIQRNIAGGAIDLFLCSLSATKYFLNSRQQ